MNVIFDHRETVAHNIHTFWFKPEKRVRYIAGQFTEIYLPHDADDRGPRRWFTLSSSPTDSLVSITTRFAEHHGSSFKHELSRLQPGMQLKLADPMGDFVLPKDASIPLVFVVVGLGVTPVHSMVKYLHDAGEQRNIQLIYAVTHEEDLAFLSLFQQYPLQLTTVVKQPSQNYEGGTGSLNTDRILQLAGNTDRSLVYLSGPEPMVETFTKELEKSGVAAHRLITDYFPGYRQF